jgi:hypothetical protein
LIFELVKEGALLFTGILSSKVLGAFFPNTNSGSFLYLSPVVKGANFIPPIYSTLAGSKASFYFF